MSRATSEGRCRQCGAAILWARGEDGRRRAVDPQPGADGELILIKTEQGKLLAFTKRWIIEKRGDGFSGNGYYGYRYTGMGAEQFGLYVPHFCHRTRRDDPISADVSRTVESSLESGKGDK